MDKFPLPIVCFSTEDWDTRLPTNKKQIMSRLAESGTQVIWIDTVGTRMPKLNPTDLSRIWRRIRASSDVDVKGSIHRISPLVIPGSPSSLNRTILGRKIKSSLQKLNIENYALWIYNPYAVEYIDVLPAPTLTIYHCVDDLSLVPGARGSMIRDAEKRLLGLADLVFCTSPALYDKCRNLNPNTSLQPNVADFEHFHSTVKKKSPPPINLKELQGPVVIFAGNLVEYKIDFELIADAARKLPHAQFVLIGPEWEGNPPGAADELKSMGNVHFKGLVAYETLPSCLAAADVLMMPYRLTDHTKNIFPLKFVEFLATGKPIVSTALPALVGHENLIPLTTTSDQFIEAIEIAIEGSQSDFHDARLALARENTWEVRISSIIELVSKCLGEGNS